MIFNIQKSLGKITAVKVDSIPTYFGIQDYYIEINNFGQYNVSLSIYNNGGLRDIQMNGWTFPYVFNHIEGVNSDDIWGGKSRVEVSFEVLDKNNELQQILNKSLYGSIEADAAIYFFKLLYNLSCCDNFDEFKKLYRLIIDNEEFHSDYYDTKPTEVIDFVDEFSKKLENVGWKEYVQDLKLDLARKYKRAQEIIATKQCPK